MPHNYYYRKWYRCLKKSVIQASLQTILTDRGTAGQGKDALLDLLNSTRTVIEYTTSNDGIVWGVPQEVLAGSSSAAWDSVADPSVVKAGDKWVELDCVVDTRNSTITASIDHFTTFAIIGVVTPAPESEPEVPVAVFRISELDIFPSEVNIGQMVTISVLVTNSGNLEGTYQVTLEIDNKVVET